jgi:hypothetical protein
MKTLIQTLFALLLCTSCAFDRQGVREIQDEFRKSTLETVAAIEKLAEGTATAEEVVAEIIESAEETSEAFVGIANRSTSRNLKSVATTAGGMFPGGAPIIEIVSALGAAALATYGGKRAIAKNGAAVEQRAVERVHRERNKAYDGDELKKREHA